MSDHRRILIDKGTDRPILISPGRLKRPRNTGHDQDGETGCPFCAGHEHMTPNESSAVRTPGSTPDAPGWSARAFPNLYPAADHHEVIAEGSTHTTHPAELSEETLAASLELYRHRIADFESQDEVECAFLFKNVGAAAGASIAHNHSQLLGLPMLPPRLRSELAATRAHGCIHCAEIATAAADDRIIYESEHHVLLSPSTPKLPYEAWLLPRDHRSDFHSTDHDTDLQNALKTLFHGARDSFGGGAFNLCLHRLAHTDFHWHFELQPRAGQFAALEIGGDMYINAITPQSSATRWRTPPPN